MFVHYFVITITKKKQYDVAGRKNKHITHPVATSTMFCPSLISKKCLENPSSVERLRYDTTNNLRHREHMCRLTIETFVCTQHWVVGMHCTARLHLGPARLNPFRHFPFTDRPGTLELGPAHSKLIFTARCGSFFQSRGDWSTLGHFLK